MKITFEGETLQHVVASIGDFLNELHRRAGHPAESADPTDLPYSEPEEKPDPTKRRRGRKTTSEPT